jgi:hypothetical protein
MDAVKFIEERNRMCKSFGDRCTGCPAYNVCEDGLCCAVDQESTLDAAEQIAIVEKWSAAHPRKTRQSVFLDQWPEAFLDERYISAAYRNDDGKCKNPGKRCIDCSHEFWMQEVE